MIMQNRVTIRGKYAQIAEEARAQQLLNRQRLNNRTQKNKIIRETKRRHDAAERAGLTPSTREGGMLEFKPRVVRKIRSGRSISERGFLLLPSSGFDAEGKIYVRSAYGENPYAVTPIGGTVSFGRYAVSPAIRSPSFLTPLRTFAFTNGRLEPGSHPLKAGTPATGNIAMGYLRYDIPNNYENASQFTLEQFLYLPTTGEIPGTVENLGDNLYRVTQYNGWSISSLLYTPGTNTFHSGWYSSWGIDKTKDFSITPIPGAVDQSTLQGIKEHWSLVGLDDDVEFLVDTGTYHFAVTSNNGQVKEFFNGNLVRTQTFDPIIGIKPLRLDLSCLAIKTQSIIKKTLPFGNGEVISTDYSIPPFTAGISSIRFTPGVELYSGSSFTPPTSITDLA